MIEISHCSWIRKDNSDEICLQKYGIKTNESWKSMMQKNKQTVNSGKTKVVALPWNVMKAIPRTFGNKGEEN